MLQIGSKGNSVVILQKKLGISTDGIYGPVTQKAVTDYQKKNGLKADGIVGNDTWGKLGMATPINQKPVNTIAQKAASPAASQNLLNPAATTPTSPNVYLATKALQSMYGKGTPYVPTNMQQSLANPIVGVGAIGANTGIKNPFGAAKPSSVLGRTYTLDDLSGDGSGTEQIGRKPVVNVSSSNLPSGTGTPAATNVDPLAAYYDAARAMVDPDYDERIQNLKNALGITLNSLASQKDKVGLVYDSQVNAQNRNNAALKNNIQDTALNNGTARSSILNSGMAEADVINNRQLGDIEQNRTNDINAILASIQTATDNEGASEKTLNDDKVKAILAAAYGLKDKADAAAVAKAQFDFDVKKHDDDVAMEKRKEDYAEDPNNWDNLVKKSTYDYNENIKPEMAMATIEKMLADKGYKIVQTEKEKEAVQTQKETTKKVAAQTKNTIASTGLTTSKTKGQDINNKYLPSLNQANINLKNKQGDAAIINANKPKGGSKSSTSKMASNTYVTELTSLNKLDPQKAYDFINKNSANYLKILTPTELTRLKSEIKSHIKKKSSGPSFKTN